MYLTYEEIFDQYRALRKTYNYILAKRRELAALFGKHRPASLTFIGCGSGYTLCRSAELSAKLRLPLTANALAAGDLLVNFRHYSRLLEKSLLVAPSRSGGTSEVVLAARQAKASGVPVLAITAREASPLGKLADLALELPWAFDRSVCQTRTITNFYAANLLALGIWADDKDLLEEIHDAISGGEEFMKTYHPLTEEIAGCPWEKVVILADSELEGIAQEAALAFAEIAQTPGNYYHVLDVRHGPMVLIDQKTLVIAAFSPEEAKLQRGVVADLRERGARVAVVGMGDAKIPEANWQISTPRYENFGVLGIPFIFIPQAVAYYKAIERGLNPDLPEGLKPWIELDAEA